ncbi:MAG: hypothetical protein SFU86_14160 [Pirellulaceae bacterium]|nr:hypothetical protein [Pirellulaceae bacterium]
MSAHHRPSDAAAPRSPWLVGPWTDLLLIANVGWPLILVVGLWGGFDAQEGVRFWQIYFVTMPHRWLTIAVVALDPELGRRRSKAFLAIAAVVVLFCATIWLSTGTLLCLLALDSLWNAWHFASQHHGIARIYGRLADPARASGLWLEKIVLRGLVLWVAFRVAGGIWRHETLEAWLAAADWGVLVASALLLVREVAAVSPRGVGRLAYLSSLIALYAALLLAVHFRQPRWVLPLVLASALFHATEYLTLVSWAVRRKQRPGAAGLFAWLVSQWGLSLAAFLVVLGLGGWLASEYRLQWWMLANVIVAYLHYAYDGMIWKSHRPVSYAH